MEELSGRGLASEGPTLPAPLTTVPTPKGDPTIPARP